METMQEFRPLAVIAGVSVGIGAVAVIGLLLIAQPAWSLFGVLGSGSRGPGGLPVDAEALELSPSPDAARPRRRSRSEARAMTLDSLGEAPRAIHRGMSAAQAEAVRHTTIARTSQS